MAGNPYVIQNTGTANAEAGVPSYGKNPQLGPNFGEAPSGTDIYGTHYGLPGVATPVASPLPLGAYIVASLVAVALSDTQIAPLIAGFLGAAIVYNGIQLFGKQGGQATLARTVSNVVTPPTPILA